MVGVECGGRRVPWASSPVDVGYRGRRVLWVSGTVGVECRGCRMRWVSSAVDVECGGRRVPRSLVIVYDRTHVYVTRRVPCEPAPSARTKETVCKCKSLVRVP